VIFAPRLSPVQLGEVARVIGERLGHTSSQAAMMLPVKGVSRYSVEGGPLYAPDEEQGYLDAIEAAMPASVEVVRCQAAAEDEAFVDACVDRLLAFIEA
jgi:uncharacterized protein (UPF0261 family)